MSCRRIRSHSNCDLIDCLCSASDWTRRLDIAATILKAANPSGSCEEFDEVDDIDARIADQPECADSPLRREDNNILNIYS